MSSTDVLRFDSVRNTLLARLPDALGGADRLGLAPRSKNCR
ncbi:hypothetical protein QN375_25350 [Pseudomonas sp. MH9.2]|nr:MULTISPECIES: hypothetical protein [unclassified Pseudomonas]MEB0029054.1 hypothetical protein [Pseudomonas sp. MH9.2]MEB0150577.1 hypothetical protein [Pseudomonas sp. CCC2.2]MEE3509598.1 hypothetical protein [Pseudomonas sp. 10C3]WPX68886.1 hypothetical protein RHM55_24880 [Pseudomonas sp. MH9.2]